MTVLSILSLITRPSRTLRWVRGAAAAFSLMLCLPLACPRGPRRAGRAACSCSAGARCARSCRRHLSRRGREPQLTLTHDRVDLRDVLADDLQTTVIVELTGRTLNAEIEQLRLGLPKPRDELLFGELPQLGSLDAGCHQPSAPSRVTMGHF